MPGQAARVGRQGGAGHRPHGTREGEECARVGGRGGAGVRERQVQTSTMPTTPTPTPNPHQIHNLIPPPNANPSNVPAPPPHTHTRGQTPQPTATCAELAAHCSSDAVRSTTHCAPTCAGWQQQQPSPVEQKVVGSGQRGTRSVRGRESEDAAWHGSRADAWGMHVAPWCGEGRHTPTPVATRCISCHALSAPGTQKAEVCSPTSTATSLSLSRNGGNSSSSRVRWPVHSGRQPCKLSTTSYRTCEVVSTIGTRDTSSRHALPGLSSSSIS